MTAAGVSGTAAAAAAPAVAGAVAAFEALPVWLTAALDGGKTSVQRSGAAQGLAAVLRVGGVAKLTQCIPGILDACDSAEHHVREGHMELLVYLPQAFGAAFAPQLDAVLPVLLRRFNDSQVSSSSLCVLTYKYVFYTHTHTFLSFV
jgi:hypothetical protein